MFVSVKWRHSCITILTVYLLIPWMVSIRRENKCMRHYYVHTIKHPRKNCNMRNILLSKCEGYCPKSKTLPLITFKPILHSPFRYRSTCCRDRLSVMRAVTLQCAGGENVYATYRDIIRCGCKHCRK